MRNVMLALLLMCGAGANAQTPEQVAQAQQMMLMPLPVDKAVRVGHLDNGLTYYIRHVEAYNMIAASVTNVVGDSGIEMGEGEAPDEADAKGYRTTTVEWEKWEDQEEQQQ